MKILTFILSVYVLLLATIPCCEDGNCTEEQTLEQMAAENQAQGDEGDCGACSPFYSCGTCTGFILAAGFDLKAEISFLVDFSSRYKPIGVGGFNAKIWQPPKIG